MAIFPPSMPVASALPMISPVILFNVLVGVIWAFKYFTEAFVVSHVSQGQATDSGAPQGSLLFYSVLLYANAFSYLKMGYASAMAWILFVIILAVTVPLLRFSSRWTYYESS